MEVIVKANVINYCAESICAHARSQLPPRLVIALLFAFN
jgi:hypothetical protein